MTSGAPLTGRTSRDPGQRSGEGGRRARCPGSHGGRSPALAALLALLVLLGCATKGDVRSLQTDLRRMEARQDSLLVEMARMQAALLDSIATQSDMLFSIRGNVNRQLLEIQEQLVMVQELTGQSQRALQGIRDQIEARRAEVVPEGPGDEGGGAGREEGGSGSPSRASAPDTLFNLGVTMFNRGSLQTARRAFERFLQGYPSHRLAPDAHFYMADIQAQENRLEQAIERFLQIPELFPTSSRVPDALYRAGLLRVELGQEEEAVRLFRRVVNSYPDSRAAELARERLEEIG